MAGLGLLRRTDWQNEVALRSFRTSEKSTAIELGERATALRVKLDKSKRRKLSRIPGPTYLFGVHEPTRRVFVLSISETRNSGVYSIPIRNELTPTNLKLLYDEVKAFWDAHGQKPKGSVFA